MSVIRCKLRDLLIASNIFINQLADGAVHFGTQRTILGTHSKVEIAINTDKKGHFICRIYCHKKKHQL